ncbi:MAG: DNA polymerase IV [Mariprofundaceae bacterium]|nr:DNA polymerase IV [Mariprofundaceae bacterium]
MAMARRRNVADGRPAIRPEGAPQAVRLRVTALGKGSAIPCAPCLDPNRLWGSACGFIYEDMSTILHVDMDAFFASVEIRDHPEHEGKPVIVGGRADARGVVAAANYIARTFGIHSAMPVSTALRLCPAAVLLPPRLDRYSEVSHQIRAIFERFTPVVEPLSLDEAFLDVSGSLALFGSAQTIGHKIKTMIRNELGMTASIGIAPNKLLAKIASDLEKPDGFVVVPADGIQAFLDPLPVSRIWGVGRVAERKLKGIAIHSIEDLRKTTMKQLEPLFGQKTGRHLLACAQGVDSRPVIPDREAKSISHERTFPQDVDQEDVLYGTLLGLTEQVMRRLRNADKLARCIELKLRFADFSTITRSRHLAAPTDVTSEIWHVLQQLMQQHWNGQPVRLAGMGVSELQHPKARQADLFLEKKHVHQQKVDRVEDEVRERFGKQAIHRGSASATSSAKPNLHDS